LARLAIRHARQSGWIQKDTPIALIGDAPSDIEAAQANRIRSIAVHTGISTANELRACGPDFLIESLRQLRLDMLFDNGVSPLGGSAATRSATLRRA
jgi:ribonucleotide monophosphatase NagD (HAD superfamily)